MFITGKIISEGETKFTQHENNKLQKISAKNKSKVQKCKYGIIYSSIKWCRPDRYSSSKFDYKNIVLYCIKRRQLYSFSGNLIILVYKV